MSSEKTGERSVVVSKEKLQEVIDLINDARSTPDEEFNMAVTTMDGHISIVKSTGDSDLFWFTVSRD